MRTLLALVVIAATVYADEPPSVDKLIEQLGSPSFPARERAAKQLLERGPAALPALRKALESKDEEVRKRAETLIPPLEIEEAWLPKRVTVIPGGIATIDALPEIGKQTGCTIQFQGKFSGKSKPLFLVDTPFWDAVEQVAQNTGSIITYQSLEKKIVLRTALSRSPFVNIRGPFRLEANWFHEDREIDFTQAAKDQVGERGHRLTLSVGVLAEPRITFLQISPAKIEQALDSEGKSLIEPARPPYMTATNPPNRGTFRSESLIASDICLRRASETAKTAKIIKGTIPVKVILLRKPSVVVENFADAAGKKIKFGDDTLVVADIKTQGGVVVYVQVPADKRNPREWHEYFQVEDDSGNRYRLTGRGTSPRGSVAYLQMHFAAPANKSDIGPPTKLIFEDLIVRDHAIPFEFRDVPIP